MIIDAHQHLWRIDQGYHDLFATVIERGRVAGDFRVDDVAQTTIALATIKQMLHHTSGLPDYMAVAEKQPAILKRSISSSGR